MELTGEVRIAAPRERVWHALNDARTLMACIPGCEEVEITSATERHVRLLVKAGPVRARFVGKIVLSDVFAGSACVMNFEGSGGTAGMATGRSSVQLLDDGDGTVVRYTATASVGGKLGQIGARMLDAASRAASASRRWFSQYANAPATARMSCRCSEIQFIGDKCAARVHLAPREQCVQSPVPGLLRDRLADQEQIGRAHV